MASPLKRLAGETAIYGLSTILARVLNFLLVPLYTRVLTEQAQYGVVAEFMAYIAVLQVVLVLGLETGCFRFASRAVQQGRAQEAGEVFSGALATVAAFAGIICVPCLVFYKEVASWLGYASHPQCVIYVAGILLLDSITAILFAQLRYAHKALKFAVIKTVKIVAELGGNLLLFLWAPGYLQAHPQALLGKLIPATPHYNYVLLSIFVSCVICVLFFLPTLCRKDAFKVNKKIWPQLMAYSLPLMLAGLPGILNDFSDRLLFRWLCEPHQSWLTQMGIYQAGIKLAVLINLCIQMFRYAAEPFFFSQEKEKDAPQTYSRVFSLFTGFCMMIFLGIMLYIDVIALFIGPQYREGVSVVPIMALAYVLLGMYFNVSIWYKLSGKTSYAVLITSVGLVFTLLVNFLFLPKYGYVAAAYGHLVSYLSMLGLCVWMGYKKYPIPYQWGRVALYMGSALALYFISLALPPMLPVAKWTVRTLLLLVYVVIFARREHLAGIWRK